MIIVYELNGAAYRLCPSSEALSNLSIEDIAAKDVPEGARFSIIEDPITLPSAPQSAWVIDENFNITIDESKIPSPPPHWAGFLISMAQNTHWQNWVDALPPHKSLALTGATLRENALMLQTTYNLAAIAVVPPTGARAEWQGIADQNNIPVDFGSD